MRCVTLFLFCALLSGCGALYYRDGDRKLSIVKVGFDTAMESGKYTEQKGENTTSIEITGYQDQAKIELLKTAIDLTR